jgi:hypothetical protein
MTTPAERYRSAIQTREFLVSLITPSETPRVPSPIRSTARALLRHFPNSLDLEEAAYAAPEVFKGVASRQREEQAFMTDVAERLEPPRLTWWELVFGSRRTDDGRNEPAEG